MSVTLGIADDFAPWLKTQPQAAEAELHLELAVALYRAGSLPVSRAAGIAGISAQEFTDILRHVASPCLTP